MSYYNWRKVINQEKKVKIFGGNHIIRWKKHDRVTAEQAKQKLHFRRIKAPCVISYFQWMTERDHWNALSILFCGEQTNTLMQMNIKRY